MLERFKQLTRAVVGCEKVGLSEDDVPTYKSTFDGTMWYSVRGVLHEAAQRSSIPKPGRFLAWTYSLSIQATNLAPVALGKIPMVLC